jgi:hypothetical protein
LGAGGDLHGASSEGVWCLVTCMTPSRMLCVASEGSVLLPPAFMRSIKDSASATHSRRE